MTRTTYGSIELARLKGHEDATQQCRESGSCDTPDGGWDSWLINGIGIRQTWQNFGEPESEDWTDSMKDKLAAYHAGALEAAAEIEAN